MAAKFYSPVIFVKDIRLSKQFYIDVFELTIQHDFVTNIMFQEGLSIWQINPEHEIAHKHPLREKGDIRFELYFESDDLEEMLQKLTNEKAEFLHKIKEEPWGQRTIRFYDPDYHLVEIGETLSAFVNRMADEGMNKEQIAEKTGIPLNDIDKILD